MADDMETMIAQIKYLEGEISTRDQQILDLKKEYESRIESLLNLIAGKEEIIKQAKNDGFIMFDDDDSDRDSMYSDSADITDDDMPPLIDDMPPVINAAQVPSGSNEFEMPLIEVHHEQKRIGYNKKNATSEIMTEFWAQAKKKPPLATKAYWLYLQQKADMNATFANPARVTAWHQHEVAYWLKNIKCEKYAISFVEEEVSGQQLIWDMNSTVLSSDLGVKMLHAGRIMREINSLKVQAGITLSEEEKKQMDSNNELNQKVKDGAAAKNKLLNELHEMKTKIKQLEQTIDELNILKNRFQDQYKAIKAKYDALKTEFAKQQKRLLLAKDYTQWNNEEVIQWLCTVENCRFGQYENKIRIAMKEENIKGKHLMDLDKGDLHRFGITDYGDKKHALNYIQRLQRNSDNKDIACELEGVDATEYH